MRCKLLHFHHNKLYRLWRAINYPIIPDSEVEPMMDDACIAELKGVPSPVCYRTSEEQKGVDISVYLWHNPITHRIFMTFQADSKDEAQILRHPMFLYPLFGSVCVNRFFYRRFLSVINQLITYLESFKEPYSLIVSGYSVGGAMSQIASSILARMFPHFYVKCHAFGSPKPGNSDFAKWFSDGVKESYRIIHGNDPVVRMPTECGWSHADHVTIHSERHQTDIPWYKRLWIRRRIIRTLREQGAAYHEKCFQSYNQHLWHCTRMASYLESILEAEPLQQTPL